MITLINTVSIEDHIAWKVHRITLHITDGVNWEMSFWEKNGNASRIVNLSAVYAGASGNTGPLVELNMSLSPKNPGLAESELAAAGAGRGSRSFVEVILPKCSHGKIMTMLGISIVGSHTADFGELEERNKTGFYLGILDRLIEFGLLDMKDAIKACREVFAIENACKNTRGRK
ncbi:hypothetical protein CTheo_7783 [Ceratobasidium theobromae]|uniref:Uncharacterized protein n=1 Tax=Ceratobasidium theobromae TaxID=1582974 RepID=A0A5N5QBJ3_9AGAM|nr:hypothetical protein CTheo_7783 [Ceratobasidium theobromae]